MEITSVNNEKIKFYQKLKQKKYRDEAKLFFVEDEHLVYEALKVGIVKEILTLDKNLEFNVPTIYVTDKIMKMISSQVTGARIIALCNELEEREVKGNIIVLDRLQDPGNLGTIIRSAVAFNFDSVILSEDSVDLYNPKVIRASEGMIFNINIIRTDIKKFLNNLDASYTKVSTDVNDGEDIKNVSACKYAIIIGNEGSGVSEEVSNLCDKKVYIKMNQNCESLNASVSASILMYEVYHG